MSRSAAPAPSPASAAPERARCPLCGAANQCALEHARASGQHAPARCWCADAGFSPALLARVPAAARGQACICARCAALAADA